MDEAVARQRDYYARTAEDYDAMHVAEADEHAIALAAFAGMAPLLQPTSILDIGAGTGRAVEQLGAALPGCRIVGVEPVEALRAIGHRRGVRADQLIDGDVQALDFPDGSFDFVIQTAVLHHVPDPVRAVSEMMRVARHGVMLSDANRWGQGSRTARRVKDVIRRLRAWPLVNHLQTRGRGWKWSEGDGLYYSFAVTDHLDQLRTKFPRLHLMNTTPIDGTDMRFGAGQVMVLALR